MKPKTLWNLVIEQYEIAFKEGEDILPQLELAKKISDSKYAEFIFPVSFMHALNLSKILDYKERSKSPSISIKYLGDNKFKVIYSQRSESKEEKYHCHSSQIWSLVESLLFRLEKNS